MSIANPLTAGTEIQRAAASRTQVASEAKATKTEFGVFSGDILEISNLAREKLQKETQVDATRKIEKIANEFIRVSSSIGRNQSTGNLNHEQATSLYKAIAALL